MIDIYITDLQAYNQGHLVGKWIKLPIEEDKLSQSITGILNDAQEVCGSSSHEEVFITDYEAEILIGEYDDIYRLNELAEIMQNFTEDDYLKLKLLSVEGYNERDVIDNGLDSYEVEIYDFRDSSSFTDTFELLAEELVHDGMYGEIPTALNYYIDYEAIARDLRMDYVEFDDNLIGRVA